MPDSFPDAARRHRSDAKHLAADAHFQNAGHLIGFAAECLVKAMLRQANIRIDTRSGLRVHFPDLSTKIRLKGHGRIMGPLLPILNGSDFLMGWRAELRYEENIPATVADLRWQKWVSDVDGLFVAAGIL